MKSEGELWAAIIFWIALVYGVFVLAVFPAYESVFMTTGYYKSSDCSSNDTEEVCFRNLAKASISKGGQFVVLKPADEPPRTLTGCTVFSKSEWACAKYDMLPSESFGSASFFSGYQQVTKIEAIWPSSYLYHWARDSWQGCYGGPKAKLIRLTLDECMAAGDRIRGE